MTKNIILERFALLAPEYQEVISGGYPQITAQFFGQMLNLNEVQTTIFENGIALYLLLFLDKAGLTHFLITECKIEPNQAEATVLSILEELPPGLVIAQENTHQELNKNDTNSATLISESTRIQILKHLQRNKVIFYQNIQSNPTILGLAEKYSLTSNGQEDEFAIIIGDIILGFYKIEDTVPLLQQELGIDAKTAALLGVEIIDFLTPLSDPNFVVPVEQAEVIASTAVEDETPAVATPYQPEYFEVATPTPAPSITTDAIQKFNAARAQLLAETSAPEIRTMASDMAQSSERASYEPAATIDEPTYTSKQPDVRTPLSGLPAYTNTHAPTPAPATPPVHEPARWS